jgi:hypothetical protein
MQDQINVVVLLDIKGLEDKQAFESHLSKEGFANVENEEFAYIGTSTTTIPTTKVYIVEVFAEALQMQNFKGEANLIFLLNETPYPTLRFDTSSNQFKVIEN